jgi:predicted DNA binding protein
VTRLCDVEGRGLYQFRLEPDVESHRDWRAGGGERLESHAVGGRWYDRVRFPDGESGSAYLEALHEAGVDARPHEMYESTKRGEARSGLTDLQRRTLELAYQQGFFEIPRKVTIGDLADQLGVSDQAVSERLRRGYATLVGSTLG